MKSKKNQVRIAEPIRTKKNLADLEEYLNHSNRRNRILFVFGINTGLRISDILKLNVRDVRDKSFVELTEEKTGKYKRFPLNKKLQALLFKFTYGRNASEPLFISQKNNRLSRYQVYRMLSLAAKNIGLIEHIGTHTMRKSFGYHHYKKFNDVAMLQEIFNHSSPSITLRYIGINQDEIDQTYYNFEL